MEPRKRGSGWQNQVRIKRNGIIVFQESATHPTKGASQLWALQLRQKIEREGYETRVVQTTTVCALLEMYAAARAKVKPLGKGFDHSLNAVAYGSMGKVSVHDLTSATIVDWALTLHEKGNAPATVMHHLATLSAAFNAALAMFNIRANTEVVAMAVKQLKQLRVAGSSERRDRRISDEEIEYICADIKRERSLIPSWDYVRLAVALPRRREELMTLEWDNVDFKRGTARLLDTKDPHKERNETIPLPPAAREILLALPRGDSKCLPYKPGSVSAAFQRSVRRLGLADLRLHDLRHEGISRLFEQGLAIEEVALVSGHTSWSTLKRYTHLRPEDVTEKMNARRKRQTKAAAQPKRPGADHHPAA